MSLKDKALKISKREGISFMEDRKKGDMKDLENLVITVNDYGFIYDDKKKSNYVVFTVKEFDTTFYFGGVALTGLIQDLESEGATQEDFQTEGLQIRILEKVKSKNGLMYTPIEVVEEEENTKKKEKK
jgi:hypothetical protein